jgi:small subunit ribosomal protein S6
MRTYEIALVLKDDEKVNENLEKIKKFLAENNVKILEENLWGRRELAYQIKHNKTGFYVILKAEIDPSAIESLNKNFLITDSILRHLFVRI